MTTSRPPRQRLPRQERQAMILAAARASFASHDYASVAIPDVARAAGGSPATVFHYFGSKEGLYAAVLAERFADEAARRQAADAALPAGSSARDRVRTWILGRLDDRAAAPRADAPLTEPAAAVAVRERARADDLAFLVGVIHPGPGIRDGFALVGFLGFLDACVAAWVAEGAPEDARHGLADAALGALEGALGDWRR